MIGCQFLHSVVLTLNRKMPKLRSSGSVKASPIPSTNPDKFAESLVLVYEMGNFTKLTNSHAGQVTE